MGLLGPQEQMENREIQERMEKQANKVLEGLPGVRASLEPKDRRETVEKVSQGQGAPQDCPALQGPAVGTDLHLWTWRDLDSQISTKCGVLVVLQAPLGLRVVLGPQ